MSNEIRTRKPFTGAPSGGCDRRGRNGNGNGEGAEKSLNDSASSMYYHTQGTGDEGGSTPYVKNYGNFFRAGIRAYLIIAISFGINILNFMVYLVIRPWSRLWARRIVGGWWQSMWFKTVACLLPKTKLVISGNVDIDNSRPAIIIANHQVDADWWYCWEFARAYGLHDRVKIILKADLKSIPVVGWGMRQFEFLFLDRNWKSDKANLYKLLGSFADDGYECCLLIFPEGTTINTRTINKSKTYGANKSRPELQHLVLPRITGFAACLDALSTNGVIPVIYDLTIAYSDYSGEVPTWEMGYSRKVDVDTPHVEDSLRGRTYQAVRLHVETLPLALVTYISIYLPTSLSLYSDYSGEVPTWEMGYSRKVDVDTPNVEDMLRGRTCQAVHLHAKRYEGDAYVLQHAQEWMDQRWKEKDQLLDRFIANQSFVNQDGNVSSPKNVRVIRPTGNIIYLLFLLCLPFLFFLSLPLLLLLTLIAWPAILLAGTLQFLKLLGRSTLGVTAEKRGSNSKSTYECRGPTRPRSGYSSSGWGSETNGSYTGSGSSSSLADGASDSQPSSFSSYTAAAAAAIVDGGSLSDGRVLPSSSLYKQQEGGGGVGSNGNEHVSRRTSE